MAISPNGKEIAFIARGEVFVTSVDKSFTKRLTNTPENERFVTWGPEGNSVAFTVVNVTVNGVFIKQKKSEKKNLSFMQLPW